jgi:hypothetical protein
MADFLQQKQREIAARLAELKPLVDEYEQLKAAKVALNGLSATSSPAPTTRRQSASTRRGPGRPRGSGSRAAAAEAKPAKAKRLSSRAGRARRGRPKGGGKRATEALTHITAQPGITIPELASKMGIKQNSLYRVLPTLEQAGSVVKQGRSWHPKAGGAN